MKAQWRDEVVTLVETPRGFCIKNGKVQIARACGLRWVRLDELTKVKI